MKQKRYAKESLIDLIANRCQEDGFNYIFKEENYGYPGDIDLGAIKYNNIVLFSCKTTDSNKNITKGLDELKYAKEYYKRNCPNYKVYTMLVYCNKEGIPACSWIRNDDKTYK